MAEQNPFSVLFNNPTPAGRIQLAVLQAGKRGDALKLSLTHSHDVKYECIGYDRTSNAGTTSLDVNGESRLIRRPLEEALRELRYQDKERYLWADVLIGSSAEELSRQASVMKTMLENSARLVVWLGPTNAKLTAAFDIMQLLGRRWQQAAVHADMHPNWTQSRPDKLLVAREKLLSFPAEPLQLDNADLWKAVEDIFLSSYFKCVQAIPELVLANEAVVMLGDQSMGWKDFVNASRAFPISSALRNEAPSEKFMKAVQLINSLEIAVWRHRNDDGLELFPMIQSSRDCTSNDPREYVFAMLPITRPSKRSGEYGAPKPEKPIADYSKSVQTVFKEAAKYTVLERQDLLLWWSETPPCGRRIAGLPTWVPDWSAPSPKKGLFVSPNNDLRRWSDSLPLANTIRVDDDFGLHIQAHALDRIETVSRIFKAENCRRLVLDEWQRVPSVPSDSARTKADRFWRTLVMDNAGLGETRDKPAKPPASMFESWRSLIAEEQILKLLNCTQEQLINDPELIQRARNDPNIAQFGSLVGKSAPFEELLRNNAVRRRFFTTVSGSTGMTSIEQRDSDTSSEEEPRVPNFDNVLGESLWHNMIGNFQTYLRERDPAAADALASGIRGELPGQVPPGVRSNDLVVACVFGFQPYILRPENANAVDPDVAGNLQAESTYRYVGSCYVHGIMDGQPFKTMNWLGQERFRTDVQLVDITIV